VARFERVEWIVQPDEATAAAALQKGEVDWIEQPLIDLCPMLKRSQDVLVKVIDPFGWQPILQLNHLHPPFNNAELRRALLPAMDQKSFVASVIGDQSDLGRLPAGYFCEGQPMASHVGLEVLTKPRSLEMAKDLVAKSGYAGEKVVMLSPSDRPVYSQMSQVARDLFLKLGLNVDFQPLDWGTVIARRTSRNPVEQGGWSTFTTALDGMTINNPGSNFALRGSGAKAWFGWPNDEKLESLRASWFDAPDLKAQKAIAEQVQLQALQTVPYVPLGQIFQPTAFRSNIQGHVNGPFALFWSVHRS
jgi:peptide/nickel transport system substrate-binding protein